MSCQHSSLPEYSGSDRYAHSGGERFRYAPPPVPQGDGALPPVKPCVPCRLQYHHTPPIGVS
nr:MAG TPA: hypothetical protein [Caudoviricetes sp.]